MNSLLRRLAGGDRFENLTRELGVEAQRVNELLGRKARLLDFGCGNMAVAERLEELGLTAAIVCVDTYAPPPAGGGPAGRWLKYRQLGADGLKRFHQAFDLAIAVDVLHHMAAGDLAATLEELSCCATFVVVKDHLEYGFGSRQLLRLSDWFGNYAYGVSVPARYFTAGSWAQLVAKTGLRQIELRVGVRIHDGLFGLIVPPRCHFISVLAAPTAPGEAPATGAAGAKTPAARPLAPPISIF